MLPGKVSACSNRCRAALSRRRQARELEELRQWKARVVEAVGMTYSVRSS